MWIVAGPNGAGKSTLTRHGVIPEILCLKLIELNADQRAQQILSSEPDATGVELRAAKETDAAVANCIEQDQDFLIETVLSTEKYLDDVQRAIERGFQIGIVYVALATPADAIRRVALRVEQGGHAVPSDRIAPRWTRSAAMLRRFVPFAHRLYVFDNSLPATEGEPVLFAYKDEKGRVILLERNRIPEIEDALAPFS